MSLLNTLPLEIQKEIYRIVYNNTLEELRRKTYGIWFEYKDGQHFYYTEPKKVYDFQRPNDTWSIWKVKNHGFRGWGVKWGMKHWKDE
jgi:hypothetical protein